MEKLTHVNSDNQAAMVDVSHKTASKRVAIARSVVILPVPILSKLKNDELMSKKGPVFQTAIIAGTMAAKKTGDLIPLCHPIGLESCDISILVVSDERVEITCQVSVSHKTGVEMEALTGASIAALTIYDMCKAMSHKIEIKYTKLLKKTGGKNDYDDELSL